jgi:hypothetical protein
MQYTTRLPAVHLRGEALTALEDTLVSGCTAPELDIELIKRRATYHYESLRAVREDVTLPGVIRSFVVRVQSQEGELELVADDQTNEFSLQLQGQREWVNGKRESIESFFTTHGARVRTFLERYMAFTLTGLVVTVGLVAYYSGMGGLIGMRTPVDALLLGSLALIGGGLFHLALNAVYPYAALITSSRARSYLTYLRP